LHLGLSLAGRFARYLQHAALCTNNISCIRVTFAPGSVISKQDLDPGVVACLEAKDACRGLDMVASRIAKVRSGNFFADFLNFSRRTDTTGWRFNAVILLVNDVVVYRTWGGQPAVNETEVHTNPLGPLQDVGPSTVTAR
jgi:hypothetical protein